mmetsp:Transcript_18532/g.38761  ORF Transcript_18532/g.38761 Transcript_18532/m.38761 type:complete len:131 (-) Transcript_18532:1624-2016(-)
MEHQPINILPEPEPHPTHLHVRTCTHLHQRNIGINTSQMKQPTFAIANHIVIKHRVINSNIRPSRPLTLSTIFDLPCRKNQNHAEQYATPAASLSKRGHPLSPMMMAGHRSPAWAPSASKLRRYTVKELR